MEREGALGQVEEAKNHFSKMANIEELYDEEHKHLCNKLGIELRHNSMFGEAIANYRKAAEIDPKDEAIYFNMARTFREWQKPEDALLNIKKGLELKPDFAEAKELLATLQKPQEPKKP